MTELDIQHEIDDLQHRVSALRRSMLSGRAQAERPTGSFQLVACRVGDERVAIRLDTVERVVPMSLLSSLPEADPALAGLLNLAGTFVPIIDVMVRLSREPRVPTVEDLIVVTSVQNRPVGLIVQEVLDVFECDETQIQDPGAELPHAAFLLGVLRRDGAAHLLLSVSMLVAGVELPDETVEPAPEVSEETAE